MGQLPETLGGGAGSWPVRTRAWLNGALPFAARTPAALTDMIPESIIGDDDRTVEVDTTGIPQRLVASLTIRSSTGARFYGTGWLASARCVLTCGHCVHDQQMGGMAASIEVVPGLSGTNRPFGTFQAVGFDAHPAWKASADRAYDLGFILLGERVGQSLGHFAIGQMPPNGALTGQPLLCAGYPLFDGGHSWQLSGVGTAKLVSGNRLFHDVDTENGTSGGPVWLANGPPGPPTAVAVHAYEKEALPGGGTANSGTAITPENYATIQGWIAAHP